MNKWKTSMAYPNCIIDDEGMSVADCPTPEQAAQIVREHNSHDALVEALTLLFESQHGPPLGRGLQQWEKAMMKAYQALEPMGIDKSPAQAEQTN